VARQLAGCGSKFVLVKGGHFSGEPVDVLYDGLKAREFTAPRIASHNTHGTGCSLASAIAARLARGDDPVKAVERAKQYVHQAIAGAVTWHLGSGHGPIDHFGWGG
jgi:hydroxymethylpyrimidine kinase/phosphomethylpyrimidine kinase